METTNFYQTAAPTPQTATRPEETQSQPMPQSAFNSETSSGIQTAINPMKSVTKPNLPRKKSSNLKLHSETQKKLQELAEKNGLTQAAYITVLITRNAEGADKAGFEREVANAKKYMR
jgi:hypothetical protein